MRRFLQVMAVLITVLLLAGWYYKDTLARTYVFLTIADQSRLQQRLSSFHQVFESAQVQANAPISLPRAAELQLPTQFEFAGQQIDTQQFLANSQSDALLVMVNGQLVHERYFGDFSANSQHISWSLAKSIVSLLFGQAEAKGLINRNDRVEQYIPELTGTVYANVTMLQLLQMSSGIAFSEDYADPTSDINRLGKTVALSGSIIEFLTPFKADEQRPAGVYNYVSSDTQVLSMALVRAARQSLTALTEQWLWSPLNMTQPGYWLVDNQGYELGFGGFNATAADYARLVDLVGSQGIWQGEEIVPTQYVQDLQMLKANDANGYLFDGWNYGLHWWLPESGGVLGIGVYNQFLHSQQVQCASGKTIRVSIAKLSSDANYTDRSRRLAEKHVALFDAIEAQACRL